MSIQQSINFESFVPNEKFKNLNKFNKKKFYKSKKKSNIILKKKKTYSTHFQKF